MTQRACQQRTGVHFFQQTCRAASWPLVVKLTISFTNVLNYKSELKIYLHGCQYPLPKRNSVTHITHTPPQKQNPGEFGSALLFKTLKYVSKEL